MGYQCLFLYESLEQLITSYATVKHNFRVTTAPKHINSTNGTFRTTAQHRAPAQKSSLLVLLVILVNSSPSPATDAVAGPPHHPGELVKVNLTVTCDEPETKLQITRFLQLGKGNCTRVFLVVYTHTEGCQHKANHFYPPFAPCPGSLQG